MAAREAFYAIVRAAIDDVLEHGYDSEERIFDWLQRIRSAAEGAMLPTETMQARLRKALKNAFDRHLNSNVFQKRHKGITPFTLAQIKPQLHRELNRRILASSDLIRLNREASIRRTLHRFEGWATSIPAGGSKAFKKRPLDKRLRKSFQSLPFEERRVIVDQGHKLVSAINEIVARDGGAIAAIWHSHWRETGYDYRPRHKKFDERIFVVRDNWAIKQGLMKLAGNFYIDQIERPGEQVFCRCYYQYLYDLQDLPAHMVTAKGKRWLEGAQTPRINHGNYG